MSYNLLLPLIKKTGSQLSPEMFQERVNIVFHDHEASHYDNMHRDMWESLQEQINLLIDDLFQKESIQIKKLNLLDIGCGTGLSTQILLNSKLGSHIDYITLLDTSSNMLKHAKEKAKNWNKEYTTVNSYVSDLTEKHNVVIICSVLHHIPDLTLFLNQVDNVLNPGGILIHLQDPNGDYLNDANYLERIRAYKNEMDSMPKNKNITDMIPKKWKRYINRQLGRKTYIDKINDQLIAENVIKKRMSADQIWSVTDIHVENKHNSITKGISFQFLQKQLINFKLINQRSYGFYGALKSDLNEKYRKSEEGFISDNLLSGRNISCIWIKNK
ncbi:class I SAM-dependent DNA methyltransferase [Flavobacterium cellulosilyticum]|uniref:Class I SAM-dependent methyltransferase n=1 Tax=Flavobacterium cellulosilyticum TaxID=2541731 RepID=A0A4R5CLS6_9FLAO|nr:class I SAM-dependent methyltransferase [Flavobacterium cellulosilyticum]TDD98414.1 class I SAM-dependent methyltransferase [Flavobacterium cellulosilyticum]